MKDIVNQLRQNAASGDSCRGVSDDMSKAADEIERLRGLFDECVVTLKNIQDVANRVRITKTCPDPTTIKQTPPPGYCGDPAHDAGPIALQKPPH